MVNIRVLDGQHDYEDELTACIGYFDGVHLGHQKLIRNTVEIAERDHNIPAVITFDPDPNKLFNPSLTQSLTTTQQKYDLIESYGINDIYVIPFDRDFAQMSPGGFIEFLNNMNITTLVCGFDWTFGYKALGNIKTLLLSKVRKFDVMVVDSVDYEGSKISSSRIIDCIKAGDISLANKLLNHSYEAVCGDQDGKLVSSYNVIPEDGRYLCKIYDHLFEIDVNDLNIKISDDTEIIFIDRVNYC